jgi:LmbE family N-acetylglucosaminyl deacetylase
MPKPGTRPLFLSPHLDDAALSCGGLLHQQVEQGLRPLVITCFAGVPDYRALSPFASEQHRRWGQALNPVRDRRSEDVAALGRLQVDHRHWAYLDCIYRRDPQTGEPLYASEESLFGTVAEVECPLADVLAMRVRQRYSPARVQLYAPLSVGDHVDHQLVQRAAHQLSGMGYCVWYYEDYPYAENPEKLGLALRRLNSSLEPRVVSLSEQDLGAKAEAIRLYRSQVQVLFDGGLSVLSRVQTYSLSVGGGKAHNERYWE